MSTAPEIAISRDVKPVNAANRFGLDYAAEAQSFAELSHPIIDMHAHIGGDKAASLYKRAAELYGVGMVYTMGPLRKAETTQRVLGDMVRFIAVPDYHSSDRVHEFGPGYVSTVEAFHGIGSRVVKFWVAPRAVDLAIEAGDPGLMRLDSPYKIAAMEAAADLGMAFMVHVADPDTWFRAKYTDADRYGTKLQQYEPFEMLMDRFDQVPWIGAHMGGWPEDLQFLTGLLERHPNLWLDCSACKWQVRELSRHSDADLIGFLNKYRGRVLYGSDIVSTDDHLEDSNENSPMARKAGSADEAFDLYASRYWAYRTMFETDYRGESPIADPDLAMERPEQFDEMAAPILRGRSLPTDLLEDLYFNAAHALLEALHRDV